MAPLVVLTNAAAEPEIPTVTVPIVAADAVTDVTDLKKFC